MSVLDILCSVTIVQQNKHWYKKFHSVCIGYRDNGFRVVTSRYRSLRSFLKSMYDKNKLISIS